jgi:hypothetical protein
MEPLFLKVMFGNVINYEIRNELSLLSSGIVTLSPPPNFEDRLEHLHERVLEVARPYLKANNILSILWYRGAILFTSNIYYFDQGKLCKLVDARLCLTPNVAKHRGKVLAIYNERKQ